MMRTLLALVLVLAACEGPSEPRCAATYYFTPPDSGWTHPDSVDLSDPNTPAVEADSVVVEPCAG